MDEIIYPIALKGLGTEFPASDQPIDFARKLVNRFINVNGQAEKRPGLKRVESPITNSVGSDTFSNFGKIFFIGEHVSSNGNAELLVINRNTSANGDVFSRFRDDLQSWQVVFSQSSATGTLNSIADSFSGESSSILRSNNITTSGRIVSTQAEDQSMFGGPAYWPFIYRKKIISKYIPIIESGRFNGSTSAAKVYDTNVVSWINSTFVSNNDLVYNLTTGSYGMVTSVGTTDLDVTLMASAGGGGTGIGNGGQANSSGDYYQVIDLVENNIFEFVSNIKDNVAVAGIGTTTSAIAISGLDLSSTKLIRGDYVYNTTRNAVTRITDVSFNALIFSVSGQASGDSLVFFKQAIPLSDYIHNHYGRVYLIDSRDKNKIVISGTRDPNDFTTFTQTLDSSTLNLGVAQPQGENLLTMNSFQRYLVIGGNRNTYIYQGTNPIADTTADSIDTSPVGLFNNGVVGQKAFANIGREMLFMSNDGARAFNITDILAVDTDNISEAIKTEFREAIQSNDFDIERLQVIHYSKRNWVLFKIGDAIYNFNYTPMYINGEYIRGGTWSKFTGLFAQCNEFLVKKDGTLVCSYYDAPTDSSYMYEFDTGDYQDDLMDVATEYESAWLTLDAESSRGIVKDGRYIKPYFECFGDTNYYVNAVADLETNVTCDSVIISARGGGAIGSAAVGSAAVGGEAFATQQKYALRWRGEQVKISINTSGGNGKETLSKFVLYGNRFGRK